jgi:hypothetical protein
MTTGFQKTQTGVEITKDPEARLTYTFDWSQWLPQGETITAVEYTLRARLNDPLPLVKHNEGIQAGVKTYVEISAGQKDKTYIVSCKVTTSGGLIDRRSFRINVEERAAV